MSDITITDNSDEIRALLRQATARALEEVGLTAEGYAKMLCVVDTGRLRNSISHVVRDGDVYIGTDVEYAAYVELGTGVHYPGGRRTPWVYVDDKGGHITSGSPPRPFLKPAATEHTQEYKEIIKSELSNA